MYLCIMQDYGTILCVDDSEAILTALRLCLSGTFREVLTLTDPEQILKTMATNEVDIVLLDMNFSLGVNSGQEGLLWLRTLRKHYPDTPVVLLTAYAEVDLAVRGLKTGAADFVVKPWDNDELVHRLRDVLEQSARIEPLERVEQEHIRRAIDHNRGNLSKAAEQLGIARQTLYNKLKSKN